ncbi:hypothetical protein ACFL20_08170 [Spirochaetota bacterium]
MALEESNATDHFTIKAESINFLVKNHEKNYIFNGNPVVIDYVDSHRDKGFTVSSGTECNEVTIHQQ